jgi:hypothetical protein
LKGVVIRLIYQMQGNDGQDGENDTEAGINPVKQNDGGLYRHPPHDYQHSEQHAHPQGKMQQ